jgi:hypothetical protein
LSYCHLLLERIYVRISSIGLMLSDIELLLNFLGRFNGITRSLLGLAIEDARLFLHLFELTVENSESYSPNAQSQSGEGDHHPIWVSEPARGGLWLFVGAAMDIFAMWLIWIRSRLSETGREWCACIILAFSVLGGSLFPVTHSADLILGTLAGEGVDCITAGSKYALRPPRDEITTYAEDFWVGDRLGKRARPLNYFDDDRSGNEGSSYWPRPDKLITAHMSGPDRYDKTSMYAAHEAWPS